LGSGQIGKEHGGLGALEEGEEGRGVNRVQRKEIEG